MKNSVQQSNTSLVSTQIKTGNKRVSAQVQHSTNKALSPSDNVVYLDKYFKKNKVNFRKRQVLAWQSLVNRIHQGKRSGLIKLPTGSGKTFLFGNVIKALQVPTLILVPRENLVDGTYEELVGGESKSGIGFDPSKVHRIYGKGKGNTVSQAEEILSGKEGFHDTLIVTYQSMMQLRKQSPGLFAKLFENIELIISDEAHRSLGNKTQDALADIKGELGESEGEDYGAELEIEETIDRLMTKNNNITHLHFTATPRLRVKSVDEEMIYSATFGEVVEDGDLILPRQTQLGTAGLSIQNVKISEKDNNSPLDKFSFEDGTLVYEKLTKEYKKEKEANGGYLPTVAFCNTTEQVEFYVKYLKRRGIKAIQCTTNTAGTNYTDIKTAETMLQYGQADVIVTCSKVGEGWDLPTLRGAMWMCPSSSPARIMQGTGRIARTLSEETAKVIAKKTGISIKYIRKTSKNTLIFSPNKWNYKMKPGTPIPPIGPGGGGGKKRNKKENQDDILVGEAFTGLEVFGMYGELSQAQLKDMGIHVDLQYLKFKTLDDYWNYFLENMSEFEEIGIGIDKKNKRIDLNGINNSNQGRIFGRTLSIGFKHLGKILTGRDEHDVVSSKDQMRNILKIFFEIYKWQVTGLGSSYSLEELKALNIPEDVLGDYIPWKSYAEKINAKNPQKSLPLTLGTLARFLGCRSQKNELMKALGVGIIKSNYSIKELKALNIPEDVLGSNINWKPYAEKINAKNPQRSLFLSLESLASLLGCRSQKNELMKALGIVSKVYSLEELKALNIPEDVLGSDYKWNPYAEKINTKNPHKLLPLYLSSLANLLGCVRRKESLMKALGVVSEDNTYSLEELKALNIPADILGSFAKWKGFADGINTKNPHKLLPVGMSSLANLLGCKAQKEEFMKVLGITLRIYSIQELKALNIQEDVLGENIKWKPYAEKINAKNPKKKLPLSLGALATLLSCETRKEEFMRVLGIISSQYTLNELKALNIPKEVLVGQKWKPYAEAVNAKNPTKKLPLSLRSIARILGCEQIKEEFMKKLKISAK